MTLDNDLKTQIRNEIIMSAKMRRLCEYDKLFLIAKLESQTTDVIDKYLKQITIEDLKDGKPILWSIVIHPEHGLPSDEYFKVIDELGLEKNINVQGKTEISKRMAESVFNYWSKRRRTGKKR